VASQLAPMRTDPMQETDDREKGRRVAALRYRMARVADLQRQREELDLLSRDGRERLAVAPEIAKLDSALRVARLALADQLHRLSLSERLQFIKLHSHKPSSSAVLASAESSQIDTLRHDGVGHKAQHA
jgi:hypothetical protein